MSPEGGGKKKFYLLGSDYVYPRTTNKILRLYLTKVKKVPESAIAEEYTPFHHQDYQTIVGKIKSFSAAGDAADRKSTRLNSSHLVISYAVFCLKKKNETRTA